LTGAGSTFVAPFFDRAFYTYNQMHPAVNINYQAIGSGGGIKQITNNTVDFGASDVPMTSDELRAAGGANTLIQIPSTVGAISLAYNLVGVNHLRLDGPAIAGIFLGEITRWNSPVLQALNQNNLPDQPITVAHRSDGSGTTYAFSDYLSQQSQKWRARVGTGKSVDWPVGVGGSGNAGVATATQKTPGAIGYVELAYVLQTGMQQAYVRNHTGQYMQASLTGATAAAGQSTGISPTNFSIVNEPASGAYPLATFSWVIIRKDQRDPSKGKALASLWQWFVNDGQQYGTQLQYAHLPKPAVDYAANQLKTMTSSGKQLLS
jgi:phosphate transport system substrate-binding protein